MSGRVDWQRVVLVAVLLMVLFTGLGYAGWHEFVR